MSALFPSFEYRGFTISSQLPEYATDRNLVSYTNHQGDVGFCETIDDAKADIDCFWYDMELYLQDKRS